MLPKKTWYTLDEIESLVYNLLCKEFGYTVGQQLLRSYNIRIFIEFIVAWKPKIEEINNSSKGEFYKRLAIRKAGDDFMHRFLENEETAGVNTFDWIMDLLLDVGVISVKKPNYKSKIIPFTFNEEK